MDMNLKFIFHFLPVDIFIVLQILQPLDRHGTVETIVIKVMFG